MELLKTAVDYMVYGVSVAGLLVILWGLLLVSKDFLLGLFNEDLALTSS